MTTENKTAASGIPSVPPVPPPPATAAGRAEAPAPPTPDDDGVRAGAVKAARAALAVARDAAKRVQAAAGGDADAIENTSATPAPGSAPRPSSSVPRPEMHYTAASAAGPRVGQAAYAGGAVPPAGGYGGVAGGGGLPTPGQPVAASSAQPAAAGAGPRRVRLTVSRVDPWSVMKLAFLLAVAVGIMTVVATAVFWFVVDGLGVFATIQDFINEAVGTQTDLELTQFVAFDRVVSLATLVAVVNVVLLTAIATIMALLYNITAALVGGVHVTLTDD